MTLPIDGGWTAAGRLPFRAARAVRRLSNDVRTVSKECAAYYGRRRRRNRQRGCQIKRQTGNKAEKQTSGQTEEQE